MGSVRSSAKRHVDESVVAEALPEVHRATDTPRPSTPAARRRVLRIVAIAAPAADVVRSGCTPMPTPSPDHDDSKGIWRSGRPRREHRVRTCAPVSSGATGSAGNATEELEHLAVEDVRLPHIAVHQPGEIAGTRTTPSKWKVRKLIPIRSWHSVRRPRSEFIMIRMRGNMSSIIAIPRQPARSADLCAGWPVSRGGSARLRLPQPQAIGTVDRSPPAGSRQWCRCEAARSTNTGPADDSRRRSPDVACRCRRSGSRWIRRC